MIRWVLIAIMGLGWLNSSYELTREIENNQPCPPELVVHDTLYVAKYKNKVINNISGEIPTWIRPVGIDRKIGDSPEAYRLWQNQQEYQKKMEKRLRGLENREPTEDELREYYEHIRE